ncbi:MAG: RNA polymerase sigma factor [Lawsonibacter sp.]|jgi:RNA polymerase sigma factor (sigma-70 family)
MLQPTNRPVDWEDFIMQSTPHLYRTALALLGDPQEAEDAVQDAFVAYLEKAPEELDFPQAWLTRVLINGCKSRLRRAWRREASLPETLPAPEPEEQQALEAIFSLSPADRAVIHLYYYEGYSTQEIAQRTGQRPGSVRSRLTRARAKLKRLLEGELP